MSDDPTESIPRPRSRAKNPRAKTETTGKTDAGNTPPAPAAIRRSPDDTKLRESIANMYSGIGGLAEGIGNARQNAELFQLGASLTQAQPSMTMRDGAVIMEVTDPRTGAEKIADAWMTVADRNTRVKALLKKFTEGGAVAELLTLHMMLAMPFLPAVLARFPWIASALGMSTPVFTPDHGAV